MKVETLKKSILQYAIEGKLVPQDPTDEPASELLKRIKIEKEQLIKDGKLKKEKPLPPITDEEKPFDLPQGWVWTRLGDIGITQTGTTPSKNHPEFFGGNYPFIKPADILQSGELIYNNESLSEVGIKNGRFVSAGSVLMVCIGGSIGKVGYTKNDCSCNQQINTLTPFIKDTFSFIFRILSSPYFYNMVLTIAPQTTLPIISKGKWEQIAIPLPPLAEQKRIVAKLEEILPLVEEYGKNEEILAEMNEKLSKQIRQSILQYAVQGKLVPQDPNDEPACELLKRIKAEKEQLIKDGKIKKEKPLPPITDDEKPFDLPNDWAWVYFRDITIQIHYGYTASALTTGNVKLARITDIHDNKIDWNNVPFCEISASDQEKYLLKDNDILIARTGGTVGKTYLVKKLNCMAVFASYLIRAIPVVSINVDYLKVFMDSPLYWEQLKNFSIGTGQPNVNGQALSRLIIPLPPLAEQKRIVAKVEELMDMCEKLKIDKES